MSITAGIPRTSKIISFEDAQDRRTNAEIDADQARWVDLRDRLLAAMMTSDLHNAALMSATINALMEALQRSGMDIDEAKTPVTSCVGMMR